MNAYEFAVERELAGMTVAEFMRWNPHIDEAVARMRIAAAKVGRLVARSGEKLQVSNWPWPGAASRL